MVTYGPFKVGIYTGESVENVARPWVETVPQNVLKNGEDLNNNESDKPNRGDESAIFQRLGMKSREDEIPDLEASHLMTRPLSPVHLKDDIQVQSNQVGIVTRFHDLLPLRLRLILYC